MSQILLRFLADENFDFGVVQFFREQGYDVVTVKEKQASISDISVIEDACKQCVPHSSKFCKTSSSNMEINSIPLLSCFNQDIPEFSKERYSKMHRGFLKRRTILLAVQNRNLRRLFPPQLLMRC